MRKIKKFLIIIFIGIIFLGCCVCTAFGVLKFRTERINDNFDEVYKNLKYEKAILIDDVNLVEQSISCGYAVIEMFSNWTGKKLTEEMLFSEYGKIVTSTGDDFCKEMNKRFPEFKTTMYTYLTNSELIDEVYESLLNGKPVPFEWAAKLDEIWTIHYSLIVGVDIPNDKITILNPYGYIEELSLEEFFERTSFEAYEDMPIYFELGFAFGVFEKNTIFIVE